MTKSELSPSVVQLFSSASIPDSAVGSSISSQSSTRETPNVATTRPRGRTGSATGQPQQQSRYTADRRQDQRQRGAYQKQNSQHVFKTPPASKPLPPRFQEAARAAQRENVLGPRFRNAGKGVAANNNDASFVCNNSNSPKSVSFGNRTYDRSNNNDYRYGADAVGTGGRSPPRTPTSRSPRGSTSSSSSPYYKQNTSSTAMTKPNNTSYENHSDSSTSASSKSQLSKVGYVKLATLISPTHEANKVFGNRRGCTGGANRRRNGQSFSSMMTTGKNSDLFAGSAASPDATALPQPPKAWLTNMNDKYDAAPAKHDKPELENDMVARMFSSFSISGIKEAAEAVERPMVYAKNTTKAACVTTAPPVNVQKFFASLVNVSPLVSITA
jgi:hypothetical protein